MFFYYRFLVFDTSSFRIRVLPLGIQAPCSVSWERLSEVTLGTGNRTAIKAGACGASKGLLESVPTTSKHTCNNLGMVFIFQKKIDTTFAVISGRYKNFICHIGNSHFYSVSSCKMLLLDFLSLSD